MSFHHLSSWYSVGTWKFDLLFAQKPVWDLFPGLLGTFRVVILEFYYQMQQKKYISIHLHHGPTVDRRNPAPGDMVNILLFRRFYTSQVVQDFFHQQYDYGKKTHAELGVMFRSFRPLGWLVTHVTVATISRAVKQLSGEKDTIASKCFWVQQLQLWRDGNESNSKFQLSNVKQNTHTALAHIHWSEIS